MNTLAQILCVAAFVAVAYGQTSNTTADPSGRLQCYHCSTFLKSDNCATPNENTKVKTCEPEEKLCRKVEQHMIVDGSEQVRTYRDCAMTGDLGKCKERTGTYKFKSWYCQCEGNKCNGADTSVMSFTLVAGMISALFVLKNRI